jgi:hypothetical protein
MRHVFENLGWWLICYLWQEFTWAVLVLSFATYFPRLYSAAVSLVSIRRRKPIHGVPHHKIGLSPGPDGSVLCTGQHGDQAGFNF